MRLKDRTAIVTGAGGGMGLGIAKCLTREGAAIVATDIDGDRAQATADQLESEGATAVAITADITDESACQDLVAQAIERFGAIDILVNNAGHFGTIVGAPFTNFTGEEWDSNYDIHVKGSLLPLQGDRPAHDRAPLRQDHQHLFPPRPNATRPSCRPTRPPRTRCSA